MTDVYKEFDELLKGFVEETLSEAEKIRFEEILKTDPEARQRYLDYVEVESMLSSHRLKVEYAAEPTAQKKKIRLSTDRVVRAKKRIGKKSRNSGAFLILAASLFLALSLGYYMKFIKKPDELSKLDGSETKKTKILKLTGDVSILLDGKSQKVKEGLELLSGSTISSSSNAELSIQTNDGSVIHLAPDSVLLYSKVNNQYKLTLEQGFLKADVNKQRAGKPLLISTINAKMTVLGTILRVGLTDDSTSLTVDEGRVQIQNPQNEELIVKDHETATAKTGKALELRKHSEYKVKNLEILSAFYGAENKWVDLTPQIRSRAGNSRLILTGNFKSLSGDPNVGIVKSLKVTYKIDGKKGSFTVSEYTKDVIDSKFYTMEVVLPEL